MKNKRIISSFFFTLIIFSLFANVRLPLLFSDGMVLQRNKSIPVWGWADDASDSNLSNKEEFPASPFRTDDLEMITANKKYKYNK